MFQSRNLAFTLATATVLLAFGSSGLPQTQPAEQVCDGACDIKLPACERSWQPYVSVVFLGRAIEVREEFVPIVIQGEKTQRRKQWATVKVDEPFIGVLDKVVVITSGGDNCGDLFRKGPRYLVYAVYARRLRNGELHASLCNGTDLAEEVAAGDLKYLRGLPSAPHGATIYGNVLRQKLPWKDSAPLIGLPAAGQKIEIRGAARSYQAIVDQHGNFKLGGLPPGRYTVSLNSQEKTFTMPLDAPGTVDVADKGCAQFTFWINPFEK